MIKKSFHNQNPNLYIMSTPIGNISDASSRLKETLEKVTILLCEDTRIAGKLLQKLEIINKPKLIRYDVVKENLISNQIITIIKKHKEVGLISDAGTPLISDPGFPLTRALKETEVNIIAIPGPVAYITALVVSGFPTINTFLGFVPRKTKQRIKLFESCKNSKNTLAFYVSCYKLKETIKEANQVYKNKQIFVAKELTKLNETYYFGKPNEVLDELPESIKGEYVLLIDNKEYK